MISKETFSRLVEFHTGAVPDDLDKLDFQSIETYMEDIKSLIRDILNEEHTALAKHFESLDNGIPVSYDDIADQLRKMNNDD